ncbi:gamma-butyrobetaine hydroxylase-like domain-containing protein [Oleiharenicola lentus]|uniref:gamma-butyrobetaine hydroxylase-like domain-containing protein n=1 Tax=Oleiharenicola lentus TaxID=2508720 RepID=UPI003F665A6B
MLTPTDIQLIGSEVAIRWSDDKESFISCATLRAASPSAEVRGEKDIFGHQYGGEAPKNFVGVEVKTWERVGNYAVRFDFSDGHRTGLYSYELLRQLGELGNS